MADEIQENKKPIGDETPVPEPPKASPQRRKRSFKIDKEAVGKYVVDCLERDINEGQDRMKRRLDRYAKLRGYLDQKTWPYPNSANFWLPVMLIYSLKTRGTLENAGKSIRPIMNAKALQRRNVPKQDRIDKLLDYQFFVENDGERKLDAFICNYVDDEAAFGFVHYVRRDEGYRDIRVLPPLDETIDPMAHLATQLPVIFPNMDTKQGTIMLDEKGWKWQIEFLDDSEERRTAVVDFYDRDDGKLEAHVAYKARVFDGPVFEILDFEDIVIPVRTGNLQPPRPENPYGAPYVNRICKVSIDSIARGMEDGTYDLLTEADFDKIKRGKSPLGSGNLEEESKEQKDTLEGSATSFGAHSYDDRQVIEHYGSLDADGDGFEEDVIIWVERKTKTTMKVAFLTEMYPGLPILRPFVSESFIPVPNRVYGMSLGEILESLQDAMKMLLDQNIDWGTITNIPFFFYRAASGMKPEVIRLEPGEGYPLDDPKDVVFPQFAQRGESYTINTMTLLQQFVERLSIISDVQFGRVPTGKASALRTMGTTLSLVAQGDARSEQVLRRLFKGFAGMYNIAHRLNQRYLPEQKEVRAIGVSEQGEDPYTDIKREEIQAPVDFEFRATMLNTNKQILSQAINEAIALTIAPLAIQAGVVSEQEIYKLYRDKYKSVDLDPDKYLVRPPNYGPKILWEEALSAIIAGEPPIGSPLEPVDEHLQKIMLYEKSDMLGLLTAEKIPLYQAWKQKVQGIAMKRQMLMAAAAQMSGAGGMGGGVPTTMDAGAAQENPPVNSGEMIDETIGRVE